MIKYFSSRHENTLLYFIYVFLYAIFLLPLVFSHDFYYPFVTIRNFSFRFIIEIQFLLWFVLILKNKKFIPRFSLPLISVLFFVAIMGVANACGIDPYRAFWGNFERMEGWVGLVHFLAYFLVLLSVFKTKKEWVSLGHFTLIVATLVGFIGLRELSLDRQSLISSTLGNSSYLAIYTIFHLFLALWFLNNAYEKKSKLGLVYLFLSLLFFVVLYNTSSRGSFISFGFGIAIIFILRKNSQYTKKILCAGLLLVLAFAGGLWSLRKTTFVKESRTLTRIVNLKSSSQSRIILWKIGVKGIQEHPILGWGQESFEYVFDRYYDSALGDAENWFDRTHNSLLDWTLAGGLLGGLAYVMIFLFTFISWKKTKESHGQIGHAFLGGIMAAYFVFNLFMFDYLISSLFFFTFIAFILYSEKESIVSKAHQKGMILLASVLAIFLSYTFYAINIEGVKTAYKLGHALKILQTKPENSLEIIKEITELKSFARRETLEESAAMIFSLNRDHIQPASDIDFISQKLNDTSYLLPKSYKKNYIHLGLIAQTNNSNSPLVEKKFREGVALSPKRQILYYELIRYHFRDENYQKAEDLAREVYELNPTINRSKINYALSAIFNKNIELSDRILSTVPPEVYLKNNLFLQGYTLLNRTDKIIDHIKKLILFTPYDPVLRLKLGMIYSELGRAEEAEVEFKKAQDMTQQQLKSN